MTPREKDSEIAELKKQMSDKDLYIASLLTHIDKLREELGKYIGIAEAMIELSGEYAALKDEISKYKHHE
jgi:hypothetical protein